MTSAAGFSRSVGGGEVKVLNGRRRQEEVAVVVVVGGGGLCALVHWVGATWLMGFPSL